MDRQLGCKMNIYGNMDNSMFPCNSTSEFDAWKNISSKFQRADSNTIYEQTGCLPSCQRNEYLITGREIKKKSTFQNMLLQLVRRGTSLDLKFRIMDGSYKEEEQYVIYDFNSFIGNVGGFLGLLLGYSVLSIYDDLESLLGRIKRISLPK